MGKHFLLLLVCVLCGCSSSSTTRNIHSGRITSQQGYSVILYPHEKNVPLPNYLWPTPRKPIITQYSFYCRGASLSLETETDVLYDCDGFSHSLHKKFPSYQRLVDIIRILNKHYTLVIREGFCCRKHFHFLQALGKTLSTKHLQGTAVLIWMYETPSLNTLNKLLRSLYKKNQTYPIVTEFSTTDTTLSNEEFLITITTETLGTCLSIELLYDLETSQKIMTPPPNLN